jgi:hypothetical protein
MLSLATVYVNLVKSRSSNILAKYPKIIVQHFAITSVNGRNDALPIDLGQKIESNIIAFQTTFCLKDNGEDVVFVATTPGTGLCGGDNSGCIRSYFLFAPRSIDFARYNDFMWEILTDIYGVYPSCVFEGLPDDILLVTGKMPDKFLSIEYLKKYAPNKKRKSVVSLQ